MNFKIEDLSAAENELIQKAHEDFGIIFDNANGLVSAIWHFTSSGDIKKAWIFISFLSNIQKSLTLSLLSTIRGHDAQSQMMLRQSLESSVLASYALYETNSDEFGTIDPKGALQMDEKVFDKARKWLEGNYKEYSEKIKFMKDTINTNAAHSNILVAMKNVDFKDITIEASFFDKPDKLITESQLWWIGNISFGLIDLFSKVIHDFPLVKLNDEVIIKVRELGVENEKIKQGLIKNPRLNKDK